MRLPRLRRRDPSAAWLTSSGSVPMESAFAEWVEIGDPTAAGWMSDRLLPITGQSRTPVGNVVPVGFEAYARVLHPARGRDGGAVRWADVAAQAGRTAHARMQWEAITFPAPGHEVDPAISEPDMGSIPLEVAGPLVDLLKTAGRVADRCWAAIWEGYGDLPRIKGPLLAHPDRRYVVARIPLEGITQALWFDARFGPVVRQSPNLLWPDDQSWCVATEIDFTWTYVAGSRALVDALADDGRLEAYEVTAMDRLNILSDEFNPLPPGVAGRL